MTSRVRLPDRRASETFQVVCDGLAFKATVGFFPDGRIGEIFLSASKANSMADIAVCDAAIAASLALQYGCPVDVLRKALKKKADGTSSGALGTALDLADEAS